MNVMTHKKKHAGYAVVNEQQPKVIVSRPNEPVPRVRTFSAKPCSVCTALRESKEDAKGKNFTRVYGTVGNVRYCRCDFCGNTWKDTE